MHAQPASQEILQTPASQDTARRIFTEAGMCGRARFREHKSVNQQHRNPDATTADAETPSLMRDEASPYGVLCQFCSSR